MTVLTAPPKQGAKVITGEELLAMGDIGPCELIDGRIVFMTPTGFEHGYIESNLTTSLRSFVSARKLGWVTSGKVGVMIRRNPDRVRGADIAFISSERLPDLPKGFLTVAPDLVVEIMSPDDRWQSVHEKLGEYFSIGVTWVWVVEPPYRRVRVFRSPTEVEDLDAEDFLLGEDVLEGFVVKVADLFAV
jgi:Uma2 family endonuclease